MKYYKDALSNIYAFELDGSQDALITADLVAITQDDVAALTAVAPSTKNLRDAALQALTHDFGDGRVMQTRPQDEQNIRNAMEVMVANNLPTIGWVMENNLKVPVSVVDLQAALQAGQLAAMQIWSTYEPVA